jgi:hypothetical protein
MTKEAAKAAAKEAAKATKEAAKATKAAEKEADKATKAAEKEAAKAIKIAEKEAVKAAAKAIKIARTAATVAYIPAFLSYETQPPVAAYHSTEPVDATRCIARRTDRDQKDRRWAPFVYGAYQCRSKPVSGSDLCETCLGHEAKGTAEEDWHGRIGGPMTADSHIAGSEWFLSGQPKWKGVAKPKTRRQAERAEKRRPIPDVELRRFILGRGAIDMDIETLSVVDNQISAQQLRDMICLHQEQPTGAKSVSGTFKSRKDLCKLIRILVNPAITEKPKLAFRYPGTGAITPPSLEVSEAEEDETLHAEIAAKDTLIAEQAAVIAEQAAVIAAFKATLSSLAALTA